MLFFFSYNANLVNAYNPYTFPSSVVSFVDNVNALAFGKTTEGNSRTLQSFHECCLEWARRHGTLLAPDKYILVQITRVTTKHNTAFPLTLLSLTISYSPTACILGVIQDKKLSWQPHLQHVKSKLST